MGATPKRLQGQTPSHARAPNQEKETAKRTGGKVTARSGAGLVKGDVRVKGIARIENKTTKHRSYSVTTETLDKLENAIAGTSEIPIMQIELNSGTHKFVLIPDMYLEDIIEALRIATEKNR
jgi:hypothetical protein